MTLARRLRAARRRRTRPPPPAETTSTSQPCSGRWRANERQRAAGPPAWSIGRWLTSSSRLTGRIITRSATIDSPWSPSRSSRACALRTDVFLTFAGKGATLLLGFATAVGRRARARRLRPGHLRRRLQPDAPAHPGRRARPDHREPVLRGQEPGPGRRRIVGNCALARRPARAWSLGCAGVLDQARRPRCVEGLGWAPLLVTLAGVPGALAALFLQSVLLGEGRMVAYNAVEVDPGGATLAALLAGFAFSTCTSPARSRFSAEPVRRRVRLPRPAGAALAHRKAGSDPGLARTMLGYGFRVYVAILLSFLVIRVDLLLVNAYLGARGGPLLGRGHPRRRDVRPADGDRAQPLPARGPRRSDAGDAPRCFARSPCSTGSSAWRRCRLPASRSASFFGERVTRARRRSTTGCSRASTASGC